MAIASTAGYLVFVGTSHAVFIHRMQQSRTENGVLWQARNGYTTIMMFETVPAAQLLLRREDVTMQTR